MANDGGVNWSEDGGRTWKHAAGLNTVDPVNIAGLFGLGSAPALYMGCGDNDDFFTRDGGKTWKDPISSCGDCDAWFSDVAQPRRVLEFLPRDDRMFVINSPLLFGYPDATSLTSIRAIPRPRASNISSGFVIRGYRAVIQTLPNEAALSDDDYVFIGMKADGTRVVFRTTLDQFDYSPGSLGRPEQSPANRASCAWPGGSGAGGRRTFGSGVFRWGCVRPRLEVGCRQGGLESHRAGRSAGPPVCFCGEVLCGPLQSVSDLPGGHPAETAQATSAFRWTEGRVGCPEPSLKKAVTAGGLISISASVIQDILFVRNEPFTRFVFGDAGVFCTTNGFEWFPLLNSIAFPGRPESGFFDPVSDPANRSLYVSTNGRSVLAPEPNPRPEIEPPSVIDLMEFAAIVEA